MVRVFADLPDPRMETANGRHELVDILVIATCAVIAGAEGWDQIAEYGRSKESFFRRFLALPSGIPSHDTFNRVFAKLDPAAFADAFGRWMAQALEDTGLVPIAIDGKSARGSPKATSTGCLQLVSAWAVNEGLVLGVRSVPEGGHEITTVRELLSALDLNGALVTIDAAGCQKETLRQIHAQGGEYMVTVKGNQPDLRDAVHAAFDRAAANGFAGCSMWSQECDAHGRHEERHVTVLRDTSGVPDVWPDVGSIVVVSRERCVKGVNASTCHFYLTSLRGSAKRLGGYVRGHWGIENALHWVLDVAFREDESRARAGHAGANLGIIRRAAVSLLKRAGGRGSIQTRRMRAAWDDDYMRQVLLEFKA